MNEDQLAAITGLLSGMQLAVVHLANIVGKHAGINPEELAASFEATAEAIPEGVPQRAIFQTVQHQIAAGIRGSAAAPAWDALMNRLRH